MAVQTGECRTPPRTLRRSSVPATRSSPRLASRRSLFREESDLSDISPLSPSSEDKSPARPTLQNTTPLKGMKCLSTLSLESPEVVIHSDGPLARVRGVNALHRGFPSSGIPPHIFYGSHSEPKPFTKSRERTEIPRAKTRLFLDDLPKDRKRARTSSGHKVKPPAKRARSNNFTRTPKATVVPQPMLGRPRPIVKIKKKKTPEPKKPISDENKKTSSEEKKPTEGKKKDPEVYKVNGSSKKQTFHFDETVNWDISFTKPGRNETAESPTKNTTNKFFKTSSTVTPKLCRKSGADSHVLTPPSSSGGRRRRSLCRRDLDYLQSPSKESREALVNLHNDLTEIMKDEPLDETKLEISKVLDHLVKMEEACESEVAAPLAPTMEELEEAYPSPLDSEILIKHECNEPSENQQQNQSLEEDSKLYPIFYQNNLKRPLSANSTNVLSPTADPSPLKSQNKKKRYLGMGQDQYQLDCGQQGLCESYCRECGLLLSKGCPEDELLHRKHHAKLKQLKYTAYKSERVVSRVNNGKVICINKDDSKAHWNRVKSIMDIVDHELGSPCIAMESGRNTQVYLYVKDDKWFAGCLVAESIQKGYRMKAQKPDGVMMCSEESYPVKCGVSRIWTHPHHRRSHIATALVNCLRASYAYGVVLSSDEVAFSAPTDLGLKFMTKYTGREDFLIYM